MVGGAQSFSKSAATEWTSMFCIEKIREFCKLKRTLCDFCFTFRLPNHTESVLKSTLVPCCAMSASTQLPTAKQHSITSLTTKQHSLCILRLDLFLMFNHVQSLFDPWDWYKYIYLPSPAIKKLIMHVISIGKYTGQASHGSVDVINHRSLAPRFCQFRQLEEVPKCSLCGGPRVFECQVHDGGGWKDSDILVWKTDGVPDYVVSGSIMSCNVLPCKGSKLIHFRREWLMAPKK